MYEAGDCGGPSHRLQRDVAIWEVLAVDTCKRHPFIGMTAVYKKLQLYLNVQTFKVSV